MSVTDLGCANAETPDTRFAVFGEEVSEERGWVSEEVGVRDEGEVGGWREGWRSATAEDGDVGYCGGFETLTEDFCAY